MVFGKWRIYAFVALAFILGLLRWRSVAVAQAEAKLRAAVARDEAKRRKELDNATLDVSGDPDDAREWLRNRDEHSD